MESKSSVSIDAKSVALTKDDFYQLLSFFATGVVEDENLKTIKGQNLASVHFNEWIENKTITNSFPICFIKNDPENIAISLDSLFTNLNEKVTSANKIQYERILSDLKQHIKSHLNGFSEEYLFKIWDQSAQSLLDSYKKDDDKVQRDLIEKILNAAKKALNIEGEIVALSSQTPLKYLNKALEKTWQEKSIAFVKELDWLMLQLKGFLEANQLKTVDGKAADSLKETVGETYEDNLDFNVLSDMLEGALQEDTLPKERLERIQHCLKSLKDFRIYYPAIVNDKNTTPLIFEEKISTIRKIKSHLKKYQEQVFEFYKSVHIARLEVNNNYIEEKHDSFFKEFHFSFLSQEDLISIPPFPIYLNSSDIKNFNFEELTEFMEINLPVKLLFVVNDVIDFKNSDKQAIKTNKWSRKLASMAINVANAYIFKSTLIKVPQLEKELLDGLNYNGPALFCIYTHNNENFNSPNNSIPYHALVNSRAFPLWTFIPSAGHEIARQFNIKENPTPKNDWSDEFVLDTPFTIIDFLASYKNLADHFLLLPFEKHHPDLIPFHEYQKLDDRTAKNKLPYALMKDEKGMVFKILPDYAIIKATDNFIGNWLTLQELANIHSIKDEDEIVVEKEKVEQEPAKSKEELSKEIITNILSKLVSGDLEAKTAEKKPKVESDIKKAEESTEPEKVNEEQSAPAEAKKEINEPYIDSILCTSCNECININSMMFAYNEDKQAEIVDASKGTFKQLVMAAEKCPAFIIHPGKPKNPDEKDLDKLVKRAEKFN